jgi:hypothetical protein
MRAVKNDSWLFDLHEIRLPLDTFKRRGWVEAVFYHELAHWVLAHGTPFGIAQQAVAFLRLAAHEVGELGVLNNLSRLTEAMHSCNFLTQEGVATTAGLEYAMMRDRTRLYQDMLDALTDTYREAHDSIASALTAIGVPAGGRGRIASFIGVLAQGSDILEDWNRPGLSLEYLLTSLGRHSPDIRLKKILPIVSDLPSTTGIELLRGYDDYSRRPIPSGIQDAMPCKLIQPEAEAVFICRLLRPVMDAVRRSSLQQNSGGSLDNLVDGLEQQIAVLGRSPPNPFHVTSVVPDRYGNVELHPPPPSVWASENLLLLEVNKAKYDVPLSRGRIHFDSDTLPAGSARVTLYTSKSIYRYITCDAGVISQQLARDGGKRPHVFLRAAVLRECWC